MSSSVDVYDFEVFYDGDCPLCMREINMLRWLDRRDRLLFTNIASETFVAQEYGKTRDDLMATIHGRYPSGEWVTGVEVFRQLYSAVGLRHLVLLTRLPVVSHFLDLAYTLFARNRLRLTGRCDDGRCVLPPEEPKASLH